MHSIINIIYNYVGKSDVHFHGDERFSNIFFDKFKNLLDDYIVNYQIKYFFYVLFISFFYLELSEGMFQLLHNYSPYHLSIFGSFMVDLCYSLFSLNIIDFLYSFFVFNLDSIGYIISNISHNDFRFSYMPVVFVLIFFSFYIDTYRNSILNIRMIFFFYTMYSFIFFILFYFGFIHISFYVYLTLFLIIFSLILSEFNVDKIDYLIGLTILSFSLLSYFSSTLCIFVTSNVFYVLVLMIVYKYDLFFNEKPMFLNSTFSISRFGDVLMIFVLSYFIVPLPILYTSTSLFILNSLAFGISFIYAYKDVPLETGKIED